MSTTRDWTVGSMPDMTDEVVVVTGANSGLGLAASKAFARRRADVVMACRDVASGEDARREVLDAAPSVDVRVRELDLASLDSVESFADDFRAEFDELDVLCNNAGVMAIPREETEDGFEKQFGVNHLGHFALTGHLLPLMSVTGGQTRVVTQSSGLHERGEMDFDDLQGEAEYDPWEAYARSKLANVLFAYELDRRVPREWDVASVCCHPGYAATNLQRRGPERRGSAVEMALSKLANALLAQSAARGAFPMLYAAAAPDVHGGEYVGPGGPFDMRGTPTIQRSSDRSYDRDAAARLWDASEELTGVEYGLRRGRTASVEG